MSAHPIQAWNLRALAVAEATFGTTPNPAAAQALELIKLELGAVEANERRPKRDRGVGRAMQADWVSGRVMPIDWSLEASVRSRSAADTVPDLNVIYGAAGLKKTVNTSTSVVYSMVAAPQESGDLAPISLQRNLGNPSTAATSMHEAEVMRGCIASKLRWSGGDKELTLEASGKGIGKLTLGSIDSATVADNSTTSVTISADDSYKLKAGGYMQWESEIIQIASVTRGATSMTVTRGALSSTAAAHSAKPMYPYYPTSGVSFSGSPISEVVSTVTLGGDAYRCLGWGIELATGIEHTPGETGSAYAQGTVVKRYDLSASLRLLYKGNDVQLAGYANELSTVALSIVQGSGAGSINTFSLPYCEVVAFAAGAPENDVSIIDVTLRARDNTTGNDAFTYTLT